MKDDIIKLENEIRALIKKRDKFQAMIDNPRLDRDMENIHHIVKTLNFDIRSMMIELEDKKAYYAYVLSIQ